MYWINRNGREPDRHYELVPSCTSILQCPLMRRIGIWKSSDADAHWYACTRQGAPALVYVRLLGRIGSIDPSALKIPARREESSLLDQFHILIFTLSRHSSNLQAHFVLDKTGT